MVVVAAVVAVAVAEAVAAVVMMVDKKTLYSYTQYD
jgi:hypothetical protein